LKTNLMLITAILLTITNISYSSIEKPVRREEFEQKAQQQQEKIKQLDALVATQKKQILDLKWQIHQLENKPEPNKTETEKQKILTEKQTARIKWLEEVCRRTGIDPNSEPNNMRKSTRKIPKNTATHSTKLSFWDIEYNMHKMNKIKWDSYKTNLLGRKVQWKGWVIGTTPLVGVDDVKILYIEMEDRTACLARQEEWDVLFWIPKNLAPKLLPSMKIEFKGTIESVTNMFGELDIHLRNVSVLRYEK